MTLSAPTETFANTIAVFALSAMAGNGIAVRVSVVQTAAVSTTRLRNIVRATQIARRTSAVTWDIAGRAPSLKAPPACGVHVR